MTFEEYVTEVNKEFRSPKGWRHGQAAFNVLRTVREDLASQVHRSSRDPFYNDSKLPSFYEWVGNNW